MKLRFKSVLRISVFLCGLLITAILLANPSWRKSQEVSAEDVLTRTINTGEKKVARTVAAAKEAGLPFPAVNVFQPDTQSEAGRMSVKKAVGKGTIAKFKEGALKNLLKENPSRMTLSVPTAEGGLIDLELIKTDIYTSGFSVKTSTTNTAAFAPTAIHYQGIIKGDNESLAAVSVFENEIMGFFSDNQTGNRTIGKLKGKNEKNEHIIYADKDLVEKPQLNLDDMQEISGREEELPENEFSNSEQSPAATKCVRVYIEADFDVYSDKGSVTNTANYLSGMFNQVRTLYANDGISITLSEIFVWNSASPYQNLSILQKFDKFIQYRGDSINGDVGTLVYMGGSSVAYVDTLCSSPYNKTVAGINSSFSDVPVFSWTVYSFAHELGHALGSQHTHSCAWNGDNSPIDSCAAPEGGCSSAGVPSDGGTIMSYCHLSSVGINFSKGFGQQPRDRMINRINTSSCLTGTCSAPTPTPTPTPPPPTPTPTPAPVSVISTGIYIIKSRHSNLFVAALATSSGSYVAQSDTANAWVLTNAGSNAYYLRNFSGRLRFNVDEAQGNGAAVTLQRVASTTSQMFQIVSISEGVFTIKPVSSPGLTQCLDIEGADTSDLTYLLSWTCHNGPNQQFTFYRQ